MPWKTYFGPYEYCVLNIIKNKHVVWKLFWKCCGKWHSKKNEEFPVLTWVFFKKNNGNYEADTIFIKELLHLKRNKNYIQLSWRDS